MKFERSTFLSLFASVALPVLAIACGGAGEDTSGGAADFSLNDGGTATDAAATSAVSVTTKTTKASGKCTIDISYPVVSIPSDKATEKAINGVLAPLGTASCDDGGGGDIESTYSVTANGNGILSILVTGSSYFEGAAHPNNGAQGYNFDLKHGGKNLVLADVITPTGMQAQVNACLSQAPSADDGGVAPADSLDAESCKSAVTSQPQYQIVPSWTVSPEGIALISETDHADGDYFQSTLAWGSLGASDLVAGTTLAAYAKAHQ